MRRFASVLSIFLLLVLTSGCMQAVGLYLESRPHPVQVYTSDYVFLKQMKHQNLRKVAVETVQPTDPTAKVNKITILAIRPLSSPEGSFTQYLEGAVKTDFFELNMLDQHAPTQLNIVLLQNDIGLSSFSTGHGNIEAHFSLTRDGTTVFDKTISAQTEYSVALSGEGVAIPRAQAEYPNLVRELLKKLYADKEFTNALQM